MPVWECTSPSTWIQAGVLTKTVLEQAVVTEEAPEVTITEALLGPNEE